MAKYPGSQLTYMEGIEIIEKVTQMITDGVITREQASKYFPELAESEDEKIRKDIVFYIAANHKDDGEKARFLYWLEKQGEFYTKRDVDDAYLKGVTDTKNEIEKQYEASYQIRKDIATFIFNYRGDIKDRSKWMDYLGIKVSFIEEKQGEQRHVDNVEPKFKVGDWIIFDENHNSVYQVERIDNYRYYLRHYLGGTLSVHFDNELIREWTIQDAKDGDMLSYNDGHGNDCIELVKSITDKKIEFWFCLTNGNRYEVFDGIIPYTNLVSREDATPATKEQRDLLFQKMKEAGYEWDAEKKELKKIEQKSSWSEEDEINFEKAIWYVKNPAPMVVKDSMLVDWLKSLKDRVQPQPKQGWSKEDRKTIDYLIEYLENELDFSYTDLDKESFAKEIKLLKSLRSQSHWKPSDEQIKAVEESIEFLGCTKKVREDLKSLCEQLKKLREE